MNFLKKKIIIITGLNVILLLMEMRTKIFFILWRIACVTDYYCHGLFDRYSGPNTGNVHIIADLFAEVIGILAQSSESIPNHKELTVTFVGLLPF